MDERQLEQRNMIGHQSFILMIVLLLADCVLNEYMLPWINYSTQVILIILLCLSYYMVRLILQNIHLAHRSEKLRFLIAIALMIIYFLMILSISLSEYIGFIDWPAIILQLSDIIFLGLGVLGGVTTVIVAAIQRRI